MKWVFTDSKTQQILLDSGQSISGNSWISTENRICWSVWHPCTSSQ